MFFFNDYDNEHFEVENIEIIKKITKEIVNSDFVSKKPLIDQQKLVGQEISNANFKMFSRIKLQMKTFTVCGDSFLRNIRIEEDSDGISDSDLSRVSSFLENNSDAFFELAAYFNKQKSKATYPTENHLFYLNLKSKHTANDEELFFISRNGNFFVFFSNVTTITLEDYINDFFGKIDDHLNDRLIEIKNLKQATHQDIQKALSVAFSSFPSDEDEFWDGAITFFDFLGWKGLWHNSKATHALRDVSDLVDDFERHLFEMTTKLIPQSNGMAVSKLISISDTVALFTPKVSSVSEIDLLELHADISKFIIENSLKKKYPIRGAICYGKYRIFKNVMIGPGIDECASWHERCDWIGAHFTPSAEFLLGSNCSRTGIIKYDKIPTKAGVPSIKYCVDWTMEDEDFKNLLNVTQSLLPEIAGKYLNTYSYLEKVKRKED